jgi:hypothetical protein
MDAPVTSEGYGLMRAFNAAFDRIDRIDRICGPEADIHQSAVLETRVLLTLTGSFAPFASFAYLQTELLSNEMVNAAIPGRRRRVRKEAWRLSLPN